ALNTEAADPVISSVVMAAGGSGLRPHPARSAEAKTAVRERRRCWVMARGVITMRTAFDRPGSGVAMTGAASRLIDRLLAGIPSIVVAPLGIGKGSDVAGEPDGVAAAVVPVPLEFHLDAGIEAREPVLPLGQAFGLPGEQAERIIPALHALLGGVLSEDG